MTTAASTSQRYALLLISHELRHSSTDLLRSNRCVRDRVTSCSHGVAMTLRGEHIGLMSPIKVMRFVRHSDCWDVWIAMDKQQENGTFYRLHDNGAMERHTINGDAFMDIVLIKPADKETPK